MHNKYVDLHIHSYYSDGTMSPEEIVIKAKENGVGLLSVTDHNILKASCELQELCVQYGLQFLPGVELDAINQGIDIHILGYGFNLENQEFIGFVQKNREILDDISIRLVSKMEKDYDNISLFDFQTFSYDKGKGGWKALHYFMEKGLTTSLREGFKIYNQYGITNDSGEYPTISEVVQHIHSAGGKAILAHPGVTIKKDDLEAFQQEILRLIDMGLDGLECYYPTHTEAITDICLAICRDRSLMITTGADCHGDFGYSEIGELKMTMDALKLGGLS